MQESSIQFQHFWIDLVLGLIMIYVLLERPLEQAVIAVAALTLFVSLSRTVQHGRRANLRYAQARQEREAAEAARLAAIQARKEALRQAQEEAVQKYGYS